MKIFELTRIRLTIWYVIIIMTISAMFSFVIYRGIIGNIQASFKSAEIRFENNGGMRAAKKLFDINGQNIEVSKEELHNLFLEELDQARKNIIFYLLILNIVILILSSLIGFYLAGKTLMPIENIIQEQKRFIADASHELKTPLTSLKTSIEVSIRSGKLPKDIKKLFQYNLEDVEALNKLIDKLLNLSSLETKTPVFDNVDIKDAIQTAYRRVKHQADKKKIKININTKNYQLFGDYLSLTELFTIFLDNGIKYSQENGFISVDVALIKNYLLITIKDNGIGINNKYLPNIFDRFYRIDSARTHTSNKGYGLGLSMAKKIVENHHGKISVASELTKGTEFKIRLPLK
ncbi:HAMP domain-containing histidine kinase [Candidatus Woesebacteria bacterium]|nr:HAMP domain-containing histidine kinase [Candidatus Woesebacteria bacterium]